MKEMSKNKIIKIVRNAFIGILLCICILFLVFKLAFYHWNRTDPRMKQMEQISRLKAISFKNQTDSIYAICIDFVYTQDGLNKVDKSGIDTLSPFNEKSIYYISAGINHNASIPILKFHRVNFPESFKIQIYDKSESNLLRSIDYDLFKTIAIPDDSTLTDLLDANVWTLIIDSTLIKLK